MFRETGLLCFSDELNNPFMKSTIEAFKSSHSAESEYKLFYGQQFQQAFPSLKLGSEGFGCYDPSGGILMADKALRAIQDLAVKMGAKIIDGFDVDEIKQEDNGNVVSVTSKHSQSHSAKSLILCPGPWAQELLSKIGVKLPLPLQPINIPVYYWKVRDFIPHTFIYEGKTGGNVWGLPPYEYGDLAKVIQVAFKGQH